MSIKKVGSAVGKGAGFALGRPIKFVGDQFESEFIQKVGSGVERSTAFTFETAGNTVDGVINISQGYIKDDQEKVNQGLEEIQNVGTKMSKAVINTCEQLARDSGDIYIGLKEGDSTQLRNGIQSIALKAATGLFAIGMLDLIVDVDGGNATEIESNEPPSGDNEAVDLETRNESLEDSVHPETGVHFETKVVQTPDGTIYKGVFPDFEEEYSVQIPEDLYIESDSVHFDYADQQLAQAIQYDTSLANTFSIDEIKQIQVGDTPDGYVWHHHEETGRLELVNQEIHEQTGHTGGRSLWGGGIENR